MKRAKKEKKAKAHVSSGAEEANELSIKKMMAKSQRVLRAIDKARQNGDKTELTSLQT
jgi:hypothetical protein